MRRFIGIMAIVSGVMSLLFGYLGYIGGSLYASTPVPHSAPRTRFAAIFLSGDMGFNVGMEPQIATMLAGDGIPVLSINSLTYFRVTRTPAVIERLLADGIRRALADGHADHVVLIGQSFGADMLHVGLASLPPDLRRKVALVALIVPEDTVQFRSSPGEVFSFFEKQHDALITARQLDWVPTVCIYGVDEDSSLCTKIALPRFQSIGLPGGHMLRLDSAAVHRELIAAIGKITKNSESAQPPVSRASAQ